MSDITLLDGSIGQELVKRSGSRATPLWSTSVMMERPDLVGEVHADYFRAGATVATTNTYAVHRSRLTRIGLEDKLGALQDVAIDQAERARAAHGSGLIAGALGPLLASYRPDLNPDPADAAEKFAEIVAMMGDRVDLLLIETVSSLQEAHGALQGVSGSDKPVWIAFSVMDDDGSRLRSGEPLSAIAPLMAQYEPESVLINCSCPEAFPEALDILSTLGLPFGGYANGFARISEGFLTDAPTVDALEQRTDLTPAAYAAQVMGWVAQGATIVGGCCEVGPDHIREIARHLRAHGHTIV